MLYKGQSRNGIGVFTDVPIKSGEIVFVFRGRQVHTKDLPGPYLEDFYIQIGNDLFLGPSGDFDDFMNHSCEPNCKFNPQTFELIAIRDIEAGEEITYDYCLTIKNDSWRIKCNCGSAQCRGFIGEL